MSRVRQDYDHLIKLLLIGDSGVGKSCLLLRFSDDTFTNSFITTIGIDFKIKNLHIDNKWIRLQIWDTAGQERFRTITSAYYRNAMGILLVYDVADEGSFKNVRNWMQNIKEHASEKVNKVLIGNKCDIKDERAVSYGDGQALAHEFGIPFIESSAKTGENVAEIFMQISRSVLQRLEQEKKPEKSSTSTTNIIRTEQLENFSTNKRDGSCC